MVLIGGMIYTFENDLIGLIYRRELYREKRRSKVFYTDKALPLPAA